MDPEINKPEHDKIIYWIDNNIEDILMVVFECPARPKGIKTKWETVMTPTEDGGRPVGIADLVARLAETRIVFEAKTAIDSLGFLFRQIRMYQQGYINGLPIYKMPIVVVCPDDTHAEKIREQRLYFLKYDPTMKFALGGVK